MKPIEKKSFEKYIEECISKFQYCDFCPPVDNHDLASRFAEILYKENSYWDEFKPEDKCPRWVFIQFKTFANSSRLILGMNFANNKITFTLTETVASCALKDQKNHTEINLFDIWLDHNNLFQKFLSVATNGITRSNS